MYAATVNRTDCHMLSAKPFIMRFVTGLLKPNKQIPGTDFAGTIEAVGKDVTSFKVGDNVFGFDDNGVCSQAEYMTLAQDKTFSIMPENVFYEEATASIEGAHYAYNMINKVVLSPGQHVLVNGATGAIGSAAVQLLKYYGAKVTGVCSTENMELVSSLGAVKVIDYTKEDFTKSGEKYSFVFDSVGKSSFSKCKPLLEPGGVYISSELGYMAQNLVYTLTTTVIGMMPGGKRAKKVAFPVPLDRLRSVLFVRKLIEEGKFKTVIDRKYPLEEIADAYRYVETGQKIGNVVITHEATA